MTITHVSCFSGIGGMDLAAEWAGFQTIAQIEKDPFCLRILKKHWPGVPKYEDIRDVTGNTIRETGIEQPFLLSGGFPCQPFSTAGKRRGTEDDRYLWPEMFRLVQELRPAWVVGENVAGILSMGIDTSLSDLESAGYSCRAFVIPAVAVGAPHQRDRVFIVAYTEGPRGRRLSIQPGRPQETEIYTHRNGENVADTNVAGLEGCGGFCLEGGYSSEWITWEGRKSFPGIWESEPGLGRVASGVPCRMDRLRTLGNAVVPQQVFPIFQAIAAIEGGVSE